MIIYAHNQRNQYDSTPIRLLLCTLIFMDITTFFFLSFMNICFDTIVSEPPLPLMTVLFLIMGFDICAGIYLLKKIHVACIVNFIIMVLLILSWAVTNQYILFLSAFVLIRFWQIVLYNDIIRDKLRPYKILFRLYVVCKIIYMFFVVGHILGCIFYLIDHTLIKKAYYGTIEQNPFLYYQGHLLCYSPIYSLPEIDHYLYCMYYIFSLMATVAYGDIIPKNPYENAYVMFLLVFATVAAGFIIQQMLVVFNQYWYVTVFQLRKARYFHDVLKYSSTTSDKNRYKLVNYLYSVLLYQVSQPHLKRLTTNLRNKVMNETVLNKQITYSYLEPPKIQYCQQRETYQQHQPLATEESVIRNIQLKSCMMEKLPNFLMNYLLTLLQFRLYPDHYILVDNQDEHESAAMFITLRGKLKLGYGPDPQKLQVPKYIEIDSAKHNSRKLFCWREFILNNKNVNKFYKIETVKLCQLLTYKSAQLYAMLKKEREESLNSQFFSNMLQAYQMAMQNQLVLMQEENQLHFWDQDQHRKIQYKSQKQSHYLLCWGCGCPNHMPVQCPRLHYKISPGRALGKPQFVQKRSSHSRKDLKSKKVGNKQIKLELNKQLEQLKGKIQNYVLRRKEQVMYLRSCLLGTQEKIIQKYQLYNEFHIQFNFDS